MSPTQHASHASPHGARPAAEMPLAAAKPGQQVMLIRLGGGKEFQHRLAEMGLTPGTRLGVLVAGRTGPFIVSVKEMRLVLGRALVERVYVRPV